MFYLSVHDNFFKEQTSLLGSTFEGVMKETNKYELDAPEEYWKLTHKEREKIVNECGPDGFINRLIPNHLLGLDISDACNIHDFMFAKAKNHEEHREADKTFLKNIDKKIIQGSKTFLGRILRKGLARIYYLVARIYSKLK